MNTEEMERIKGFLETLLTSRDWDAFYIWEAWDKYIEVIDDLGYDEVKDAVVYLSKTTNNFPDAVTVRSSVLFHRKLKMAGLAAQ